MAIKYFSNRRNGPETDIEDTVASQASKLLAFNTGNNGVYIAGSPAIGAGMPDIVIAACDPQVFVLSQLSMPIAGILAFLRAVSRARLETIADRVGHRPDSLVEHLNCLVDADVIKAAAKSFSLAPPWRLILPEIITVEVKVNNWRRAVEQASRNRIFTHRSYVALPSSVAERVKGNTVFKQQRLGLLAVDGDQVNVIKRAPLHRPLVWTYYYQLAYLIAANFEDHHRAICRGHSGSEESLPGLRVHRSADPERAEVRLPCQRSEWAKPLSENSCTEL
jgi:hypothetical protein